MRVFVVVIAALALLLPNATRALEAIKAHRRGSPAVDGDRAQAKAPASAAPVALSVGQGVSSSGFIRIMPGVTWSEGGHGIVIMPGTSWGCAAITTFVIGTTSNGVWLTDGEVR